VVFGEGDAAYLAGGSSILLQVHYNTQSLPQGAAPAPDETKVQLWTLPDGQLPDHVIYRRDLQVPLSLPAGEPRVVIESRPSMQDLATVGPTGGFVPGEIVGVMPHAQQLATEMYTTLIKENGALQCLIKVPSWQSEWQLDYMFDQAAPYTNMDKLHAVCVYDNSADHQPTIDGVKQEPQRVNVGDKPVDEMCQHYVWLRMDRHMFLGY
jgi:hypothetical protein